MIAATSENSWHKRHFQELGAELPTVKKMRLTMVEYQRVLGEQYNMLIDNYSFCNFVESGNQHND